VVRRDLSSDEESLWQAFARTILPLHRRRKAASGTRKAVSSSAMSQEKAGALAPHGERKDVKEAPLLTVREVLRPASPATRPARMLDRLEINGRQPGLDTTSWNALSSGKMKPQKRLDLHGHFAQDAFFKLHHFLHASSAQGVRCVEVITGLGSGQEGGVIRQELPHWLERGDLRPLILAVVHTHKRNKGAVRILLRARHRV